MFKALGNRLLGALGWSATVAEAHELDDKLAFVASEHRRSESLRGLESRVANLPHDVVYADEIGPQQPRVKFRDSRNHRFHAKRAGVGAAGLVSHRQANNHTLQYMNNPLLHGLLFQPGIMDAKHKGTANADV